MPVIHRAMELADMASIPILNQLGKSQDE